MAAMDTLHAYKTLRSKFDEDTAKTLVETMADLVTPSFADLATKTDIEQLRQATKTDIHDVKAEIEQLRLSTKSDMEQLRLATKADIEQLRLSTKADIQEVKTELIRWLFGAALAIVSAMGIMLRFVHGPTP
jgi:hypothetical protein